MVHKTNTMDAQQVFQTSGKRLMHVMLIVTILGAACFLLLPAGGWTPLCNESQWKNGSKLVAIQGAHDLEPTLLSNTDGMAYFPQAGKCGSYPWMVPYNELHKSIITGKVPPRYLVSIAAEAGLADRLTGLVTQFYMALLSSRALTMVTYGHVPALDAVCDMANFNWTQPLVLPEEVLNPMKTRYTGTRQLPPGVNTSVFYSLFSLHDDKLASFARTQNFKLFPSDKPGVEMVLSVSNRGGTYSLLHNPHHKQQLWGYGLTPESAFMCGFFSVCKPNNAVEALYQQYWQAMADPGTLKIGIQVRLGDRVFSNDVKGDVETIIAPAAQHFACASKLEQAYALPGQKVIWYLISDSLSLCQAAKEKFGSKILTETSVKPLHVDCGPFNPNACSSAAMNLALQHALGQMLTFSMADYHVISMASGFGRVGAWLSGKYSNIFEVGAFCDPAKPTLPNESAAHWAGIR